MLAHDRESVKIAYQFPLYPMLNNLDTESSRDNHGRVWNTKRNHFGWWMYLRKNAKKTVPPYASPAHRKDFRGLPPAYSFVGRGEPFYAETLEYIRKLKEAGIWAEVDVYPSDMHAFDMLDPANEVSKKAVRIFEEKFEKALLGLRSAGGSDL
jgi:acetyl esterase/lipase